MYMDANPTCRQLDVHGRKGLAPRLAKSHKTIWHLYETIHAKKLEMETC